MNEELFKNNINEDMESKINNIPDKLMKSFTKRAIRDAQLIINIDDPNFEKIAYAIFKGYSLGFTLGNLEKISNKK